MNAVDAEDRGVIEHYRLIPAQSGNDASRQAGSWQRIRRIGHGSFGTVYLEQRTLHGDLQSRAVKKIDRENISFAKELLTLTRLNAPKYEAAFGHFKGWYEDEECVYFAMEYFPLGDIHQYAIECGYVFSEVEVCKILCQLLEGIKIMHEDGIAHRDLKPSNIFVSRGAPD